MIPLDDVCYLLPLRRAAQLSDDDLPGYLAGISSMVAETIVVDGSAAPVFAAHAAAFCARITHVRVDPTQFGVNGKVAGVRTGLALALSPFIVIADDDVRYSLAGLQAVRDALERADIVRPQNYFDPLPWHAVLDEGRSLIARATGGDWPGTLALRRAAYDRAGDYDANVLFENLELVRTIRAAGGTERILDATFVRRLPPTTRHYAGQRLRQAYDEWARPARLLVQLALAPLLALLVRRFGIRGLLGAAAAAIGLAELGRQRGGARRFFPLIASLASPIWVLERSVTSWLAISLRLRGGVRYAGQRLQHAATAPRLLRSRFLRRQG
jgi:hypothetical protein